MKLINKIIISLTIVPSFLIVFILILNISFYNKTQPIFKESTTKRWSHRGVARNQKDENTLLSIEKAIEIGYEGVEIDLWYNNGVFFLSHDENYNDSLSTLEDVFNRFPEASFWLDIKNIKLSNYKQITNYFNNHKKNSNSYIIESKNGFALGLISWNNINTSYWVSNNGILRNLIQKLLITVFNFKAISMPASEYLNNDIRKEYKHLNIHLWAKFPQDKLYKYPEVKILLDDNELKENKMLLLN